MGNVSERLFVAGLDEISDPQSIIAGENLHCACFLLSIDHYRVSDFLDNPLLPFCFPVDDELLSVVNSILFPHVHDGVVSL